MLLSQEEKKQDWENWRKETTETLKKIQESLSSKTEGKPQSLSFDKYLNEHADACPECQKVLEKHGYKKEEKKEPGKPEKKEEPWSVSDV